MTRTTISPEVIEQTIKFHGHSCPGLALGIRASEWALAEFGRAVDEDIVAVVETDMCAVDAVQFLTGCTFGKGNLIYMDYGKNAFTFYRRSDGKAIRIVGKSKVLGDNWHYGVPIEIIPLALAPIMMKLEKLNGKPVLRIAKAKAGPVVSDNGNFIVDVDFGRIDNPSELNLKILQIPGVVDTGLFLGMAQTAYIGQKDGTVKKIQL